MTKKKIYNTKYWSFTWETNVKQKKLPKEEELKKFLDNISESAVFQFEKGSKAGKLHIQGGFVLKGPRQFKKNLLDSFKGKFYNVGGLSLQAAHDMDSVFQYCSKNETRIGETIYAGRNEIYDLELSKMKLRPWQNDLIDLLKVTMDRKQFRDRKIVWVEDNGGNTGKSALGKYLAAGQKEIRSYKLPVSSVDRLNSAVTKITQKNKVDLFFIDLTRSKGKEQHYGDLFAAIEDIKNGHVVNVMYGDYVQAIFEPPQIVIFTNMCLSDFRHSLSEDRWMHLIISKDNKTEKLELQHFQYSEFNLTVQYTPVREIIEKYQAEEPTLPDEQQDTETETI